MGNNRLPTILKHRSQFQKLSKEGHRVFPSSWLVINYDANEKGKMQYGWTIPKFVGNAVTRNRFKRWCREFVRLNKTFWEDEAFDINFVLRRQSKDFYKQLSHEDFDKSFLRAFRKVKSRIDRHA